MGFIKWVLYSRMTTCNVMNKLTSIRGKFAVKASNPYKMALRLQSSEIAKFREFLKFAKKVAFLTGAGMSAESGVPTFRGLGGYWRNYSARSLDTLETFERDPGLVWEFYHYRREVAAKAQPNLGHKAIAEYEKKHINKEITVITQNIDGLHRRAGTQNLLEIHGCLFKTRCIKCGEIWKTWKAPFARGDPDIEPANDIPKESLPHCKKPGCNGLLRPHVVWFGEGLEVPVFEKADAAMTACEVCIVVGSSNLVYPAAGFPKLASVRGAVVAEFNLEPTGDTRSFDFFFEGACGKLLPLALAD